MKPIKLDIIKKYKKYFNVLSNKKKELLNGLNGMEIDVEWFRFITKAFQNVT